MWSEKAIRVDSLWDDGNLTTGVKIKSKAPLRATSLFEVENDIVPPVNDKATREALLRRELFDIKDVNKSTSKFGLFDDAEDVTPIKPVCTAKAMEAPVFVEDAVNYKELYFAELLKSKSLKQRIAELEVLVMSLQQQQVTASPIVSENQTVDSDEHVQTSNIEDWERLAQEEKTRRTKFRQLNGRPRRGRGTTSNNRRGQLSNSTALPTHTSNIAPVTTTLDTGDCDALDKIKLMRMNSKDVYSVGQRFSSDEDNDTDHNNNQHHKESDQDSGWDNSDTEDRQTAPIVTVSTDSENVHATSKSSSSSTPAQLHASTSSLPPTSSHDIEMLEIEIEESVLRWAMGKDVRGMLQSLALVYHGELPDLGPCWSQCSPDQLPVEYTDVRKAYLKCVRYCHPDKQTHHTPARQKLEASKVFAALSDAHNAYKSRYA